MKMANKVKGFSILAYSGSKVNSWRGPLILDTRGFEFKNQIPVLRQHDHLRVVGHGQGYVDPAGRFWVKGKFSNATADALEVQRLVEEGQKFQASVGVEPKKIESLSKGEKADVNGLRLNGPAEIWRKSYVGEVSVVPWGADPATSVEAVKLGTAGVLRLAAQFDIFESGEGQPGPAPRTFGEAMAIYTKQGHQIDQAITLARKAYPTLYNGLVEEIFDCCRYRGPDSGF
jgi:hypothetical protein